MVLVRLGRLPEAEAAFRRVTADPQLAALSYYHLGRIAEARGRGWEAERRYRLAGERARDETLQRLAHEARAALPPAPPAGLVLLELAVGYDSAAGFRDEGIGRPQRTGDAFGSLWVYGERRLTGDTRRGLKLIGNALAIGHMDESDANECLPGAAPSWGGVWTHGGRRVGPTPECIMW